MARRAASEKSAAAVGVALALSLCGCARKEGGSGEPAPVPPFECLSDWPEDPKAAPEAPLSVMPAVVWRKEVGGGLPVRHAGIVLSGENVVVSTQSTLVALNRHTGEREWWFGGTPVYEFFSAPIADAAGNVYVGQASGLTSVDAAGKHRWSYRWAGSTNGEAIPWTILPVLSPDGLVFTDTQAGNNFALTAVRASDGKLVWSLPNEGGVTGGVANALLTIETLREHADGKILGQLRGQAQEALGTSFPDGTVVSYDGLLGQTYNRDTGVMTLEGVGRCDNWLWSTSSAKYVFQPSIVGFDGVTYMTGTPQNTGDDPSIPNQLIGVRRDGTRLENTPFSVGRIAAVGADDTVYVTSCSPSLTAVPLELVAYSRELTEKWRLTIGNNCAETNVLIADDGLLYFAASTGVEIVAVQTPSPGLARTAWPSTRHDNHATSWLGE